jgi:hypothetical protein
VTTPAKTSEDDRIDMRLHELHELVYYDRRADFLMSVALDEAVSAKTEQRLMCEADAIYRRARACAPRATGDINVRANVIDVLRRMGGLS